MMKCILVRKGMGQLSLFSDPIDFGNMEPKRITVILHFSSVVNTKTSKNQVGTKYIKPWFENESKPIIIF